MIHIGTKVLETKRLILRPFTLLDAAPMFANWANDPEVTRYLMWKPHGNVNETLRVLGQWINSYQKPDYYQWAITLKGGGDAPVGSIGAVKVDTDVQSVHIGYCIGVPWWNQGITSEALGGVIGFFFEKVGVNRVDSRHDPNNPNSGKVMQKCGMVYEGTMRQADRNGTGICDSAHYAILADDYFKQKGIDKQ